MFRGNVRIGQDGSPLGRLTLAALGAEAVADFGEDLDQQVYFGGCVVEIEAGPGAGGDSEPIVQGPRAMMAGTDGNALEVEQLSDVVRMGLIESEADEAGPVCGSGAENVEAVDLAESIVSLAS